MHTNLKKNANNVLAYSSDNTLYKKKMKMNDVVVNLKIFEFL